MGKITIINSWYISNFTTAADFSTTNIECLTSSSTFKDEIIEFGLREQVAGQFIKYASDEEQDKSINIHKTYVSHHIASNW